AFAGVSGRTVEKIATASRLRAAKTPAKRPPKVGTKVGTWNPALVIVSRLHTVRLALWQTSYPMLRLAVRDARNWRLHWSFPSGFGISRNSRRLGAYPTQRLDARQLSAF